MIKLAGLTACAVSVTAAIAVMACSSGGSVSVTTGATPRVSMLTRAQCGVDMGAWEKRSHFGALLGQLAEDVRTYPLGTTAEDRKASKQMAGVLASDVTAAQKDAPPACVPGFTVNYDAALTSLLAADRAAQSGTAASVQQVSGNFHAAGRYLQAATRDVTTYATGH